MDIIRRLTLVVLWTALGVASVLVMARGVSVVQEGQDSIALLFAALPVALAVMVVLHTVQFWNNPVTAERVSRIFFPIPPMTR